jgi:formamidopyrimidine-DNA glycosylase
MPELPEVQTTVNGLNRTVKGRKIIEIWTDYTSQFYKNKDEIKNPIFFKKFKRKVIGQKILKAERRGKNILIHLSQGESILVHMKMTGYFFYNPTQEAPFIHLTFSLDNGRKLAFSDMRKFAKVTLVKTDSLKESLHLRHLGPEPLDPSFKFRTFSSQLRKRSRGKIKQVLMDQSLISGIGNIYSDEILWRAGVHPLSHPDKIPEKNLRVMFKATKDTLRKGVRLGGDSMSDYRNIKGEKGQFQEHHRAYQKHKTKCSKKGCSGLLEKIKVGARSAHFCPKHQKLFV